MTLATEQEFEAALRAHKGIKSQAAVVLGMTRQAVQDRVDRSPYLQAVIRDIEETTLDVAETNIGKAMDAGDMTTSRWYAELKGGQRGFRRKIENTVDEDQLAGIVAAFGGNVDNLKAFRAAVTGDSSVAEETEDEANTPRAD